MKKLSTNVLAVITVISILCVVAFTFLWATMTGTASSIFAAAVGVSAVIFILTLNRCVHFA